MPFYIVSQRRNSALSFRGNYVVLLQHVPDQCAFSYVSLCCPPSSYGSLKCIPLYGCLTLCGSIVLSFALCPSASRQKSERNPRKLYRSTFNNVQKKVHHTAIFHLNMSRKTRAQRDSHYQHPLLPIYLKASSIHNLAVPHYRGYKDRPLLVFFCLSSFTDHIDIAQILTGLLHACWLHISDMTC